MDSGREGRTIKADRRARAVVIAGCAGAVLLGLALIVWVIPWGQDYLKGQEPCIALRVLQAITALIFLSFLPVSGYMFWFDRVFAASVWGQTHDVPQSTTGEVRAANDVTP